MQLSTLFDVICAAHLSAYVASPFASRGGIMLVAYGESLKTSMLEVLEFYHPAALIQTDLTVQMLGKLRERIAQGIVHSLVLTDFQKIYERNPTVAGNVEGTIRAMVAEGFTSLAFQEQQINRSKARAMVLGAITPAFLEKHFHNWGDTGFVRRFIFPAYRLQNPDVLIDSIVRNQLIDFGRGVLQPPRNKLIPFSVSQQESERLQHFLRYQYGQAIPLQLLQKILAVLKWSYAERGFRSVAKEAMATIEDFSESLMKEGAELVLPPLVSTQERRSTDVEKPQPQPHGAERAQRK